jgi:hypothetical protein
MLTVDLAAAFLDQGSDLGLRPAADIASRIEIGLMGRCSASRPE